jgi:hypothetical protein
MAIKIGLVAGTGQVTIQHGTGNVANHKTSNLKYDINGATINFFQLTPKQTWLGAEQVVLLQDAAGLVIGNEVAVRAYLDAFIGAEKAL